VDAQPGAELRQAGFCVSPILRQPLALNQWVAGSMGLFAADPRPIPIWSVNDGARERKP
jgi:hypothetical protein